MKLKLQQSEFIPPHDEIKPHILYHSPTYDTAIHLCPCGCSKHSVTPIGVDGWALAIINEKPILHPSILNKHCPNKAHYYIRDGEIVWCGSPPM